MFLKKFSHVYYVDNKEVHGPVHNLMNYLLYNRGFMQKIKHRRRLARDPIHTAGFMFMKGCEFAEEG